MDLYLWRHPKPNNVQGLCFGQTEVAVDARKIKRLAHRINHYVKRHKLPKVIWVSPLSRCHHVGEQLQKLGFQCLVDRRLMETHFGVWENRYWHQISKAEIDAWCDNFAQFAPEGGESLTQLFARATDWLSELNQQQGVLANSSLINNSLINNSLINNSLINNAVSSDSYVAKESAVLVVGHAGWITTVKMIAQGQDVPSQARDWPRPVKHGQLTVLTVSTR
ncbi:histidine phosphatase family protein [uncultured Psychrobacter sp.]|uniref:histidine phosphatase family protein n=1 Tax=uncultured Psychrobacter sp. TaxID=259303 RepID=UPI00259383F1|nr:histidine phosphatase family protein [uncultured Psychrobacter sp.]